MNTPAAYTAPRTDINHPGRPRTWVAIRPHGGWTIGQGKNLVSLSLIEADRLVALITDDGALRYSSTTPPKGTA